MQKYTKASLRKLSQEELQLITGELVIKFQENDTKEMLINSILFVQLKAEYEAVKEELKELKAQPSLKQELIDAGVVIDGQTAKINELEAQLSAPSENAEAKTTTKKEVFVKIGKNEYGLNKKLKIVIVNGETYTREEALENGKVMGILVECNYPHLVKK